MCKVDTLTEEYELSISDSEYGSVDEYLRDRWTGADGNSPQGYKTLTEWFNKRVLKSIYEEQGRSTVSVHLEREYDTITGDESIQRAELAADLAADGIEIDDLRTTLISTGTMRNHLKDCLDARKEPQSTSTTSNGFPHAIDAAKKIAASKTQEAIPKLVTSSVLPKADEADITVEIKLTCPECSNRIPIEDAIERGYICRTHSDDPQVSQQESV